MENPIPTQDENQPTVENPIEQSTTLNVSNPTTEDDSKNNTGISQIVTSVIDGILDNKEAMKLSNEIITKQIEKLREENRLKEAQILQNKKDEDERLLNIEKNTVYTIKTHITLYSSNVENTNGLYYKNVTVELMKYDVSKNVGFLGFGSKPSPYSYDFNDSKFTKIDNLEIKNYLNKIDISNLVNNYDNASKFDKFSKGWTMSDSSIANLKIGKADTLLIDLVFYIKDKNIYTELPSVNIGTPTNLDSNTIKNLKKINKLSKSEEMNYNIRFGAVNPALRNLILNKLNTYYQHVEYVEGNIGIPSLFGQIEGGSNIPFLSYLLKPKKNKRKTYKKLSKKLSKKSNKKSYKRSHKK